MSEYFHSWAEKLHGRTPAEIRALIICPSGPNLWLASNSDCRAALLALAFGEPLEFESSAPRTPLEPFLSLLKSARDDAARTFELLATRYSNPLNFNFAAEEETREHVLTRLMTADRVRAEKQLLSAEEKACVLMKLNLTAVAAARTPDLRFLDALNYYYELLPSSRLETVRDDSLLVSYLALYGQALAAHV